MDTPRGSPRNGAGKGDCASSLEAGCTGALQRKRQDSCYLRRRRERGNSKNVKKLVKAGSLPTQGATTAGGCPAIIGATPILPFLVPPVDSADLIEPSSQLTTHGWVQCHHFQSQFDFLLCLQLLVQENPERRAGSESSLELSFHHSRRAV